MLLTFGLSIEDRILKVFAGTVTVTVTLLIAVCGYLFKSGHPATTAADAYIALVPLLLLIPSFLLIVDLRKDMARIAGYLLVFVVSGQLGARIYLHSGTILHQNHWILFRLPI